MQLAVRTAVLAHIADLGVQAQHLIVGEAALMVNV